MAIFTSFEFNDTLQITKEQGFPQSFDINTYISTGIKPSYNNKVYTFVNKPRLRNYVVSPVRCFLVENIDNKRIYRGHCQIQSITHDYNNQSTSGTFIITHIFTPQEICIAHDIIDRNPETDYFKT